MHIWKNKSLFIWIHSELIRTKAVEKKIFYPKKQQKKRGKRWKNRWDNLKIKSKMVDLNPTISITTLNVNSLNTTSKRQRLSNRIRSKNYLSSTKQQLSL